MHWCSRVSYWENRELGQMSLTFGTMYLKGGPPSMPAGHLAVVERLMIHNN